MPVPSLPQLPITECPDGAGALNNPANQDTLGGNIGVTPLPPNPYVPPDVCVGDLDLVQSDCVQSDALLQESLAAENLNISGAPLNVFKLLGVHEQGRLIDLTGQGEALGSGTPADAFDTLAPDWQSTETGLDVLTTPAFIGYDFGTRKTSFGQEETLPGTPEAHHITSFRIQQGTDPETRALQVRVERSDGGLKVDEAGIQFSGVGNGSFTAFQAGRDGKPGVLVLLATAPTQFSVTFISAAGTSLLGSAVVGQRFHSLIGSFTLTAGTTPFAPGDLFTVPLVLDWYRVDVVNLPNIPAPALIRIRQSKPSRFWRIVPLSFAGASAGKPWVIQRLELFDYQETRLDDIQDTLFMENRDRDYANTSIQLKVAYTVQDAISDLSKFGFQVPEMYSFTTHYGTMIRKLGRPIVVGDILELPPEMQYDHNLRPVRKFLEVTDVAWSAEGFTTTWKPIMYRFQAQQLIPGQEHRDLLGTVDTQKYVVDDGSFFAGIEQIQTSPLTVTESNTAEALQAVPETGTNVREFADGTNRHGYPGSYGGVGPYVEDGLPPDGAPYTSGFKLPDVSSATDGEYFRLEYDPKLNIAARLYKFSAVKNKWIYVETDRRAERSAHKPSQQAILNLDSKKSLTSKL